MTPEDSNDHREPLGVDAGADATGHREVGSRHERLHLEQQRARALESNRDRSAHLAGARTPEERGRVGHADEPGRRHLEDAELVRGAEAVLRRTQDAVGVVAVALELEHAVDEMLEHAWAGDGSVLRHVPDEDGRDAGLLRDAHQAGGRLAHLRDGPGRGSDVGRMEGLHRVDDADVRTVAHERIADGVELGLGQDPDRLGTFQCGAERVSDQLPANDPTGAEFPGIEPLPTIPGTEPGSLPPVETLPGDDYVPPPDDTMPPPEEYMPDPEPFIPA